MGTILLFFRSPKQADCNQNSLRAGRYDLTFVGTSFIRGILEVGLSRVGMDSAQERDN